MRFTEMGQLKDFLKNEAQTPSICPVRFINVETMDMWVQIKAFLSTLSYCSLQLSNFCEDKDTAPNLNRLKHRIRTSSSPSLVVPLSEYLRINNLIAKKTIDDILKANYENNVNGKLRIYIPLYRMKEILKDTSLDPRQKNCILYLDTNSDSDYSLTIVQDDLELSIQGNQTRGYKEYLMYWEQNPDKPVILHTKNAIQYKDIVFADDVTVIISAYDLLRYHYKMPADIKQDLGTESQWKELSQGYNQTKSLEGAICFLLPAYQYSENLFERWLEYTSFKRWLLWLWTKSKQPPGYLGWVGGESINVDNFEDLVYTGIIKKIGSPGFDKFYQQRKKLIEGMKLSPPQSYFEEIKALSPNDQIACLTDNTKQEKHAILLAFSQTGTSKPASDVLKATYPDAYAYLGQTGFADFGLEKYISTYKTLKLTNCAPNDFLADVNEIAKGNCEWVWRLPARNALIQDVYHSGSIILFVDALGIEYMSLLQHLFDPNTYETEAYIGHCNLPSSTSFNTDFLDGRKHEKFYKLDELKHSAVTYPENLVMEFELLHEIKVKVDECLRTGFSVIITSDHGTSRMAVLYRDQAGIYTSKENAQRYKYGRYCVDAINDYSEIEGCIPYNGYWIFANYSRFAEKGAPHCETHGGASLEEMIVPVLQVRKKGSSTSGTPHVKITGPTSPIKLSKSKTAIVRFKLSEEYASVIAVIANQRFSCEYANGEYKFEFPVGTSDHYTAKLVSNALVLGEFSFTIVKGITKSGFDI